MHPRRTFTLSVACITGAMIVCGAALTMAAPIFWQCQRCGQQFQGDFPPRNVTCPGRKDNGPHIWFRK